MKKFRIIQFALLASGAFILGSCKQDSGQKNGTSEKVQHYRHLLFSETPWDPIRGTYEISDKEAKTVNNYTFTYDDSLRLTQVDFCRGDSLLNGSRLGAARVVINYEGNKEIRHYFNKDNEPQTIQGKVFTSVYTLDESGFRKGLKFYDKENQPVENRNNIGYYVWSMTPDGKLKENRYTLDSVETVLNQFCPFYELRFSYNKDGIVTQMANYEADTLYNCTAENCGNIGVSYFTFNINNKGDLLEFSVHSTTGQLSNLYWGWARYTQKVDENGYVIERSTYDQDNELVGGKMIPIRLSKYDESGSLIEERFLDADRQLMENPGDGVAVRQFKYDKNGVRTETISYNKNMDKIES